MGLLKPLLIKLIKGNWSKILPMVFKAAAEGQFGEPVKTAYWWLAGKKTVTGALLVGVGAGLEAVCASTSEFGWACTLAQYVYYGGMLLAVVGLADGGTRAPWPEGTPKDQ
jgi:uncharacterized membrane protein YedE/YeeE